MKSLIQSKNDHIILGIGVLMVFLFLAGCNEPPKNPTYVIERRGVMIRDEHFDVIRVYGFNDNERVAKDIAGYLNRSEGARDGEIYRYGREP